MSANVEERCVSAALRHEETWGFSPEVGKWQRFGS
jgi:hypothetical protein